MDAASEEHTGRTVQLGHNHTLCTVDDKSTIGRHIRNRAQENVLDDGVKVLVVGVRTVKLELGLEGHAVSESSLQTFLNGIARRVDVVVEKLQHEVVTCVGNGEVLAEHLVQAIVLAKLWRGIQLQKILEALELHVKEIRVGHRILYGGETDSLIVFARRHQFIFWK